MLVVEIEENGRTRIVELDKSTSTIGRSSQCAVRLRSDIVSGQHARIQLLGQSAQIQDLGSSNGLIVNNERVGTEPVPIWMDSVIQLGNNGPVITVIDGPPMPPKPVKQGVSRALMAAVGCLIVCLGFCIVGLILTSGAVLINDPSLISGGSIKKSSRTRTSWPKPSDWSSSGSGG